MLFVQLDFRLSVDSNACNKELVNATLGIEFAAGINQSPSLVLNPGTTGSNCQIVSLLLLPNILSTSATKLKVLLSFIIEEASTSASFHSSLYKYTLANKAV